VRDEVRRSLRRALILLLLLVGAPAVARARPCPECLSAGVARVELVVPAGAPLAGYGSLARRLLVPDLLGRHPHAFWFKPSEGERDRLAARALVLESTGSRVALVTVDLLAVDATFTADVERRLAAAGVPPATLLLAASHTHSGPGAYVDSAVLGWLATDRLDRTVRDALLDGVVAAVRAADRSRRPARLAAGSVVAPPVTSSRLKQPLDAEILVLRITGLDGAAMGLLWNFAIHGTMLGAGNLQISGDVMGGATALLERELGVPALYVNGAVGDVSPGRHGARAVPAVAAELAAAVRGGWAQAVAIDRPILGSATRRIALPPARLSVRNCLRGWVPASLTLPLGSIFPRHTAMTAVAIGDTAVITVPGELQTRLGIAIKRAGRARFARTLVAGLSNDYLGYFVTAQDHERPSYVTCATVYGPGAGECLAGVAIDLLAAVTPGVRTPPAEATCEPG
jgi:hypothetical protein